MRSPSATAISSKTTHIAAILALAACATAPPPPATCPSCPVCPACPAPPKPLAEEARYDPVDFSAIPGWAAATLLPSAQAFLAGCARIAVASPLRKPCETARASGIADEASARRFFESQFSAYAVASGDGSNQGLVTGYYEPILRGSRSSSSSYRVPVYGVPQDLIVVDLAELHPELRNLRLRGRLEGRRLVPYWSRADIEKRAQGGNAAGTEAPILAWVEDPVELFFLQVQGSGQIQLDTGERIRLGYADQNGHPYRSLGRHLVDKGELALEQASMQGIKAWARANPAKLADALQANPSYVFFRVLQGDGPIGALGVPLSSGHSVAIDPRFIALGAPVFLATTMPNSSEPLERLMVAQDTGGAIRGAVRADVFWGSGESAGTLAGRMRQQGRMWLLWPRGEAPPKK